jgi:hypothetical protein
MKNPKSKNASKRKSVSATPKTEAPKTEAPKTEAPKTEGGKNKTPLGSKEVMANYLIDGPKALDAAKALGVPKYIFESVSEFLESRDAKKAKAIDEWITATFGESNGQKGRKAAIEGEERDYSSQRLGDDEDGARFIRLDVSMLTKKKGDKVRVRFSAKGYQVLPIA